MSIVGCAASAPRGAAPDKIPARHAPQPSSDEATAYGEPTAREAARALTMKSAPDAFDCDCNGIPDSVDVREGRASDANHNGQDDYCDDDPEVRRVAWSVRDTATFFVRHQCEHEIGIRYRVPQGGAEVRLTVRTPSGNTVRTLLRRRVDSGAYDRVWDETDDHGATVTDGIVYSIRFEVGRLVYMRTALWRRTP